MFIANRATNVVIAHRGRGRGNLDHQDSVIHARELASPQTSNTICRASIFQAGNTTQCRWNVHGQAALRENRPEPLTFPGTPRNQHLKCRLVRRSIPLFGTTARWHPTHSGELHLTSTPHHDSRTSFASRRLTMFQRQQLMSAVFAGLILVGTGTDRPITGCRRHRQESCRDREADGRATRRQVTPRRSRYR